MVVRVVVGWRERLGGRSKMENDGGDVPRITSRLATAHERT